MKLNYKVLGEGKSIIILHGLFGSLDNWMTLAKSWSKEYQVWLIDQRNHGQSAHSDEFSYELMVEDLRSFIQEHDLVKPVILGHSMGGKTAMLFAMMYPDLLDKLIVVDIAPVSYQVHHYPIIEAMESLNLSIIESRKQADVELSKKLEAIGVRQFLLKNLYRKERDEFAWRFNLPILKREIEPISEWNVQAGIYDGETLFIKGGASDYILEKYSSSIADQFTNYTLTEVENAGHWVHAEATELFSEKVRSFMKV